MPSQVLRRYFRHGLFPQLMVFEAVARLGSVTRAAEELRLAQPTASTQIKKLSETLGLALLEQRGRQLHLTPAGRELLAGCEEVTAALARTESRLGALRSPESAPLRLAAAAGGHTLATRLLATFCVRYPDIAVRLRVLDKSTARVPPPDTAELDDDEIYLLPMTESGPGLKSQLLATEWLHLYVKTGHALAKKRALTLSALMDEPFILREPGSRMRERLLSLFTARGLRLLARAELAGNTAIAEAVAQGLGIAMLPEGIAQPWVRSGAIIALDAQDFPLQQEWGIAHGRGRPLTPAAALFLQHALEGKKTGLTGKEDVEKSLIATA